MDWLFNATAEAAPVLGTEPWRVQGPAKRFNLGGGVDFIQPRFQDNPAFRVNGR